jgi:hypothetical protein
MTLSLQLPTAKGDLATYTLRGTSPIKPAAGVKFDRIAYSAAHVVADPRAAIDPWLQCAVDWDATIAYRRRLWSLGLGVAEAMDTAQRGMGLNWSTSLELIRRSLDAANDTPGALVASGCGTDHLALEDVRSVGEVVAAYEEQMAAIEKLGGKLIVMASRALARVARGSADYERVYDRILRQAKQPVILHWLGDMFDPALAGYWGTKDVDAAMDTALGIIAANASKVDGIKISLLDKDKEIAMRRRLPAGVRMYTGDDFNYAATGSAPNPRTARAMRCWESSTPSHQLPAPRSASWPRAMWTSSTRSSDPRYRCRATSLPRPRASTRPAWSSWLGSMATKATSRWSAASKARARCRTWPNCSAWPMRPTCSSTRSWRCAG